MCAQLHDGVSLTAARLQERLSVRSDEATHLEAVDLSTLTMGRPIGKGGFATIWFARWQGNDLAIKVFNVAARAGLSCTKLAMLRRLRHPSICALFGHMWVDEWPALVLEYMVGGSLAAYLFHPRPAFCKLWFPLELAPGPLPPLAGCSLRWVKILATHMG